MPPIICSRRQFQIFVLFSKITNKARLSCNFMSYFFFRKFEKLTQNLSSAAIVIGALRVCILFCRLLIYLFIFSSKSFFSKNSFMNIISVSNSLDPVQARRFVEPDLGPNSLQRLLADDTRKSRERVNFPIAISRIYHQFKAV